MAALIVVSLFVGAALAQAPTPTIPRAELISTHRLQQSLPCVSGTLGANADDTVCVSFAVVGDPDALATSSDYETWCETQDDAETIGVSVDHVASKSASEVCAALHNGSSSDHDYTVCCWGFRWGNRP